MIKLDMVRQEQIHFSDTKLSLNPLPKGFQLLKWIGNKQRFATKIISYFPKSFNTYIEPFLGSGGVLSTFAPNKGIGSDTLKPLMEIWTCLKENPDELKKWYSDRWNKMKKNDKVSVYNEIRENYNKNPNGADLLFMCRSCYGGVIRFRKIDGGMSSPCGIHDPITPTSFSNRVDSWNPRVQNTKFLNEGYESVMKNSKKGDLIYCDPPYVDSQKILYGGQDFLFNNLIEIIKECKDRGVFVAVSIDGVKKSGKIKTELNLPDGLFEREIFVKIGRSMLKRFQMNGKTLEKEEIKDRLLLTY
jgi:DNA adenine methylase